MSVSIGGRFMLTLLANLTPEKRKTRTLTQFGVIPFTGTQENLSEKIHRQPDVVSHIPEAYDCFLAQAQLEDNIYSAGYRKEGLRDP